MKKILSIFAAALVAIAVNAAVWHVSPTSSDAEGEHSTCNIYRTLKAEHAQPGDTVLLADGAYDETQSIYLNNSVVIMAEEGAHPVIMQASYFKLLASAKFIDVKFQHNAESNGYCMYLQPGCTKLELEGCEITNFKETCIMSWEEYALNELIINNCYFHDNVKSVVYDPSGYIANTVITNSTFANNDVSPWSAGLIDIRKGASGDPKLMVDHCTFYHNLLTNSDYGEIRPRGLTDVLVSNCIFAQPEDYERVATRFSDNGGGGEVRNVITHHYTKRTNQWGHYDGATLTACAIADPLFVDAANGDFTLGEGSPAINYAGKDADGNDITVTLGDPRWVPSAEPELENGYYLVGTMNNWQVEAEYKLVLNEQADDTEYMYDITFAEEDRFKVVDYQNGNWTWHPGEGDGYVIDADHVGEATVYFRPNGKQGDESWYYTIIYVAMKEEPQPAEAQLWKATAETPTAAGSTLIDDDLLTLASVYESFVSGTNHTYGEEVFAKAFQVRAKNAPTEDNLTGEENETTDDTKKASPLVLTAKEDIEVTFYYRQQQTAETPAAENDNKDLWIYDQAAITAKLTGTHTSVDVSADSKYAFVTKKMTFTKNHVYTLTAVGTTLPLFGLEYKATEGEGETTALTNTEASAKAVKMMENGQLVIIKNGVKYNVLGTAL